MSELEEILGEAAAEIFDAEEQDDALEFETTAASSKEESEQERAKGGGSGASGSGSGAPPPDAVSSTASLGKLLADHGLVDVSTPTRFRFADAGAPNTIILEIPTISWVSGRTSMKCICLRAAHGKRGSCNVWFNNVGEDQKKAILAGAVRWAAEGRTANESTHYSSGRAWKRAASGAP